MQRRKLSTEPEKDFPNTEKVKEFWNNAAEGFSEIPNFSCQNAGMNFLALFKIESAKNILEMGCGNGDLAIEILTKKNPNADYQTFDLSENLLEDAVKKLSYLDSHYKDNYLQALNDVKTKNFEAKIPDSQEKAIRFENLRTTICLGDAENLPLDLFPSNNYDVIISNFVLHLVNEPLNMLKEAYRVLAPGGRAAFTVWGKKENSEFFTLPKTNMMKFDKFREMSEKKNVRSNFHQNDRDKVLDSMEEVGFKGCRSIDLFTFFDFNEENMDEYLRKHVTFCLRMLKKRIDGDEELEKLYEELVEMTINDFKNILVKERRLFGFKTYLYYGNK